MNLHTQSDHPVRELNVGIIGFGRIGLEHAGWIESSRRLRLAMVFDPTPARAQLATVRGAGVAKSIDELLADPSVDVVLIATPTSMHFEQARQVIQAGKHVMVEKPATLDAAQAVILRDLAEKHGVKLTVFQSRRWDIDYLTVKHAVQNRIIGKVFNVESRIGQWGSCVGPAAMEYRPNWRNERAFGGGGLYDWGSHLLDQLWQLMLPAKPTHLFAQLRGNVWTQDCDDLARIVISFDNGGVGICEINTSTTRPLPRWHIDGELGSANSPASLAYDTNEWARLSFTRASDGVVGMLPPPPAGWAPPQIWDTFAEAITGSGEVPVTIESVITTMTLLDAARASSASGKSVEL